MDAHARTANYQNGAGKLMVPDGKGSTGDSPGSKRSRAMALVARPPKTSRPKLEITPDQEQYTQLCRDLQVLRGLGASSNTDAIIDAVHERAERGAKVSREPQSAIGRRAFRG
jgi:hypothetical protein